MRAKRGSLWISTEKNIYKEQYIARCLVNMAPMTGKLQSGIWREECFTMSPWTSWWSDPRLENSLASQPGHWVQTDSWPIARRERSSMRPAMPLEENSLWKTRDILLYKILTVPSPYGILQFQIASFNCLGLTEFHRWWPILTACVSKYVGAPFPLTNFNKTDVVIITFISYHSALIWNGQDTQFINFRIRFWWRRLLHLQTRNLFSTNLGRITYIFLCHISTILPLISVVQI